MCELHVLSLACTLSLYYNLNFITYLKEPLVPSLCISLKQNL